MPNVVILGSGMGGFGAAYKLHQEGITPTMYDKNGYHGGHTASFRHDSGFIFDLGPHISFTKDPRMQDLFADSVDQMYETMQVNLNNYWRGYWPQHPVQQHLHGLPQDVIVKVISDFVEEEKRPDRPINNYGDWLLASFGRSFAELFPHAVHEKISPHHRREHEYRLAGATHLSAQPGRGAARGPFGFNSNRSLHYPFPLSDTGRIHILLEEICPPG